MTLSLEGRRIAVVAQPDDAIRGKKLIKNIQLFWTCHKFLDSLFPIETQNSLLFEKLFTNFMFRGLCD